MKSTPTFHSPPELILSLRCEYRALNEVLIERCKMKPRLLMATPCFAAKVGRGFVGSQERETKNLRIVCSIKFSFQQKQAVGCSLQTSGLENQSTILWAMA